MAVVLSWMVWIMLYSVWEYIHSVLWNVYLEHTAQLRLQTNSFYYGKCNCCLGKINNSLSFHAPLKVFSFLCNEMLIISPTMEEKNQYYS